MDLTALIFDFDATLAEAPIDFGLMSRRVEALARDMGFQGDWPAGYTLEQVEKAARRLGDGYAQRAAQEIESIEMEAASRGRLFEFTLPLLARARSQGYGLAVITRNCGPAVKVVFPQVEELCQVFLPREAVRLTKPHPQHVLDACRALGVEPGQAVMVGDHPTDMQAAAAAGCLAVGVASGQVDEAGLRDSGARVVLPHAGGVLEMLEKLAG